MSLRTRLVLAFVTLTTAAAVAVGAWSYAATVDRLYAEIDRSLADIAAFAQDLGSRSPSGEVPGAQDTDGPPGGTTFSSQVIDGAGTPVRSEPGLVIPVDDLDRALAAGTDRAARAARDLALPEGHYRLLTVAAGPRAQAPSRWRAASPRWTAWRTRCGSASPSRCWSWASSPRSPAGSWRAS